MGNLLYAEQSQDPLSEDDVFELYRTVSEDSPSPKTFLTDQERRFLFYYAANHPVARLDRLSQYDPSGHIGFCFGRAMTVHLIARRMGLSNDSIRKLFIIGYLDTREDPQGDPEWRFHVTTLVKGEKGAWYAVDPIMQGVMSIKEWVKYVRATWDKKNQALLYMTSPSTIIPDLRVVPEIADEKGENVLELSFDPREFEGFTPKAIPGNSDDLFFEVGDEATATFFTHVYEEDVDDSFKFLGISVNDKTYFYNNYFVDLLIDLTEADERSFGLEGVGDRDEDAEERGERAFSPSSLHSPRFYEDE